MKKTTLLPLVALISASLGLAGCASSGDEYASDVYDTNLVNTQHEAKVVKLISVMPSKVAVKNKSKGTAQIAGSILGAVAGAVLGHNVGSGSDAGTLAGGVAGATLAGSAASSVKDKTLVDGVALTYQENGKTYVSAQVARPCLFQPGDAVVVMTKTRETRIQPNAVCPKK